MGPGGASRLGPGGTPRFGFGVAFRGRARFLGVLPERFNSVLLRLIPVTVFSRVLVILPHPVELISKIRFERTWLYRLPKKLLLQPFRIRVRLQPHRKPLTIRRGFSP